MATPQRDWNQNYLEGHTPWDKGAPSPALLEVIASGELPAASEVLMEDLTSVAPAYDGNASDADVQPKKVRKRVKFSVTIDD